MNKLYELVDEHLEVFPNVPRRIAELPIEFYIESRSRGPKQPKLPLIKQLPFTGPLERSTRGILPPIDEVATGYLDIKWEQYENSKKKKP